MSPRCDTTLRSLFVDDMATMFVETGGTMTTLQGQLACFKSYTLLLEREPQRRAEMAPSFDPPDAKDLFFGPSCLCTVVAHRSLLCRTIAQHDTLWCASRCRLSRLRLV